MLQTSKTHWIKYLLNNPKSSLQDRVTGLDGMFVCNPLGIAMFNRKINENKKCLQTL